MNLFKQYVLDALVFGFVAVIVSISAFQAYSYNLYKYLMVKIKLGSYGK